MSSYHDQNFRTSKTSYKLSLYQFIASETLSNSLKELTYTKIAKKDTLCRKSGWQLDFLPHIFEARSQVDTRKRRKTPLFSYFRICELF